MRKAHGIGEGLVQYIDDLNVRGFQAEAAVVGNVLQGMIDNGYLRTRAFLKVQKTLK
jgi:hypothetical protein